MSLKSDGEYKNYIDLGTSLYQAGKYKEAVDAFNNLNALKENPMASCQGAGFALLKLQEYDLAIAAFRQSLAIHKDWQSYLGLGTSLYFLDQFYPAIDAFKEAISLHEDWHLYQGLGNALKQIQQYEAAIDAFSKSVELHSNWRTYQDLGQVFRNLHRHEEAVEAYNKSLEIHEDWETFQSLGFSLANLKKEKMAEIAFKKGKKLLIEAARESLAKGESHCGKNAEKYHLLCERLVSPKNMEPATRAFQLYLRYSDKNPHQYIDPFLGQKSWISVSRQLIDEISESLSKEDYLFCPSFGQEQSEEVGDELLESWKNIVYIHIPKTAGTNFILPLETLPKIIASRCQKSGSSQNNSKKHYLWYGNLGSKYMHDAYISEAFQSGRCYDLNGSFIANHWGVNRFYCEWLAEHGISSKKICLLRDPAKRLYSHVRHLGRKINDKTMLLNRCLLDLWNLTDRYIYDYDLFREIKEPPYCQPYDYKYCDDTEFFDVADTESISRVKSSLLTASQMPNIVQYNRLNNDKLKTTATTDGSSGLAHGNELHDPDFREVFNELVSRGYLERDVQINLDLLKQKTKDRLNFPSLIYQGSLLHPITLVFPRLGEAKLMLTKDFLSDPFGVMV